MRIISKSKLINLTLPVPQLINCYISPTQAQDNMSLYSCISSLKKKPLLYSHKCKWLVVCLHPDKHGIYAQNLKGNLGQHVLFRFVYTLYQKHEYTIIIESQKLQPSLSTIGTTLRDVADEENNVTRNPSRCRVVHTGPLRCIWRPRKYLASIYSLFRVILAPCRWLYLGRVHPPHPVNVYHLFRVCRVCRVTASTLPHPAHVSVLLPPFCTLPTCFQWVLCWQGRHTHPESRLTGPIMPLSCHILSTYFRWV